MLSILRIHNQFLKIKKNLSESSPKPNLVLALNLFNTKNDFNVTLLVILKIK